MKWTTSRQSAFQFIQQLKMIWWLMKMHSPLKINIKLIAFLHVTVVSIASWSRRTNSVVFNSQPLRQLCNKFLIYICIKVHFIDDLATFPLLQVFLTCACSLTLLCLTAVRWSAAVNQNSAVSDKPLFEGLGSDKVVGFGQCERENHWLLPDTAADIIKVNSLTSLYAESMMHLLSPFHSPYILFLMFEPINLL